MNKWNQTDIENQINFFLFSVFNLANKTSVEETKKKVELYKRENEKIIRKNNSKLVSMILLSTFLHSFVVCVLYFGCCCGGGGGGIAVCDGDVGISGW